jgi:DNA primase
MIPPEIIDEIKYRCDIAEVISGYVPLKRAGSNYNGLCPFHSERTPSFTVFPSTKSFYCFGCGAGGDVITFVMKRENLDYRSALELLAKRAGISLPQDNENGRTPESIKRERILNMNREAARFYHACLYDPKIGAAGLKYLTARGLTGATIKHFGLGFAPDGFNAVTNHLMRLGYTTEEMSAAFLCGISKKTGRPYDYFRNRIIFPIIDVTGNVVAFGGRVMDDSMPKYLNSSDTPVFKKSRNLFALNFAKSKCSERLILCEGYMDVIALHAHGFENSVATLGTAITPDHARIISRYTKQVIVSYDSDDAGQRAAEKAMKLLGEVGIEVRVLRITGAKDPDEFLTKNGPAASEKFKLMLERSRAKFEYKFENVLSNYDISLSEDRVKAANELCRIISEVYSEAEREVYIGIVSEKIAIPADSLRNDVKRMISSRNKAEKKEELRDIIRVSSGFGDRINNDTVKNAGAVITEENILGILLLHPENIKQIKRGILKLESKDFYSDFNRKVFDEMINRYDETREFDFGALAEVFNPDEMGRITSMLVRRQQLTANGSEVLSELIERLLDETRKKSLEAEGDDIEIIKDILAKKGKKKN